MNAIVYARRTNYFLLNRLRATELFLFVSSFIGVAIKPQYWRNQFISMSSREGDGDCHALLRRRTGTRRLLWTKARGKMNFLSKCVYWCRWEFRNRTTSYRWCWWCVVPVMRWLADLRISTSSFVEWKMTQFFLRFVVSTLDAIVQRSTA